MLLGDRGQEAAEGRWEAGGRVQSTVQPEMKWIIECGINTANNLGSPHPLFPKERKSGENRGRRDGQREEGVR